MLEAEARALHSTPPGIELVRSERLLHVSQSLALSNLMKFTPPVLVFGIWVGLRLNADKLYFEQSA
eukprot:6184793-Pleurochrysis_carterae.AAC.1